jgi:hypothetical protein
MTFFALAGRATGTTSPAARAGDHRKPTSFPEGSFALDGPDGPTINSATQAALVLTPALNRA